MAKMSPRNLMMLLLSVSLVIGAGLTGSCVGKETPKQIIEGIAVQDAFTLIQENRNNPNFVIIDMRWPILFANGHIDDAINIDLSSETFREGLNQLDKDKTYLIYYSCSCGGIGWKALDIIEELNFREVYLMWGGSVQWKEEGLPIIREGCYQYRPQF